MLCPDCAKGMSGYGRKEYDRGLKRWRDIWYCPSENKWWERGWNGEWIRRFDLEGAEEPGACQTQTKCPECKVEGGISLSAVYESVVYVSCSRCGYSSAIDMGTVEGIELADYYFEFSRFKPYTLCPNVGCEPYNVYEHEKLHSLCSEYWHCPIMKYLDVLSEVELSEELVEKVKERVKGYLEKIHDYTKGRWGKVFTTCFSNKMVAAYKWFIFRTILEVAKNEREAVGRVELHELG